MQMHRPQNQFSIVHLSLVINNYLLLLFGNGEKAMNYC